MISLAGAASTTWLLSRWFRAINLDGSFWMNFFRYSFWKRFSISFFSWMHFLVAWLMFSWNLKKIPRVPSHYWCFNQMRSLRKVTFLFGLGWERTFEKRWAAWIHTLHQGSVSRHITSEDSIFSLIFFLFAQPTPLSLWSPNLWRPSWTSLGRFTWGAHWVKLCFAFQ